MSERKVRGKAGKKRARRLEEIEARRQDVSHALDVLRLGMHREFTFLPKGEKWLLPSVAFGLGLALAGRSSGPAPPYRDTTQHDPAEEPAADGDAVDGDAAGEASAEHSEDGDSSESPEKD